MAYPNFAPATIYAFPVTGFSPLDPPNVPAPTVVLSDTAEEADAHGAMLTKHQRYLWVADRGRNFIWVIETQTDEVVNEILLAGRVSDDPTPDLLATSPNGSHVFMSLRGPNPLSADPHVSTGSTPGIGVIKVQQGSLAPPVRNFTRRRNLAVYNAKTGLISLFSQPFCPDDTTKYISEPYVFTWV